MRNFYDQRADRSISAHDLPQSFVNALVYELPVGKGRKFGSDMHPVADAIIGGMSSSAKEPPATIPTWDECAAGLLAVYEEVSGLR